MHPTAFENCKKFKETYGQLFVKDISIVEIGSQDVNGSLRSLWTEYTTYTGVDFVEGKGVNVVLSDPYKLPFESNSVDIILSSSVFEHSEMFWLLFLEIMRVLTPNGLFYLNAPSNGDFHRWPVDCYRFYPDAGKGLVSWAKYNNINCALLESYVSVQSVNDQWNDFVAVFLKDESYINLYPNRILDNPTGLINGTKHGSDSFVNFSEVSEDQKKLMVIKKIQENTIRVT